MKNFRKSHRFLIFPGHQPLPDGRDGPNRRGPTPSRQGGRPAGEQGGGLGLLRDARAHAAAASAAKSRVREAEMFALEQVGEASETRDQGRDIESV